ncbi:hypothetical protein AN639_12360 [Candidatus Epulonipiscium fishelsonii]|uniref:Uncharacterized protein n=1 Tax=Candidatus Epulonipiscium fishelsonii TaxID=77094 RepID=A0ACC8XC06_9FIRM|nr:hypothetical protein AN396_01125 [Epulopiscium sp. SCG-B11WGA-EpuloA1]ONI42447.1 hypothetical protein AN639_12360 [Epulopiscium sp. SCG-B05WGA-EpuloA1]
MTATTKMPKSYFYSIVLSCAVIIFCECLQVLVRVRDPANFAMWGEGMSIETYMLIQMSYFFERITVPIMLGLYTYFAFIKLRIGKLFICVWGLMLAGATITTGMEFDFTNILYYLKMIAYFINIISVIRLWQVIELDRDKIEEDNPWS